MTPVLDPEKQPEKQVDGQPPKPEFGLSEVGLSKPVTDFESEVIVLRCKVLEKDKEIENLKCELELLKEGWIQLPRQHDDVKAIVNKTKPEPNEAEADPEPARKPRGAAEPKIDSGSIEATDRLRDVPRAKWHDLMLARRQFLELQLSSDCRHLVEFVNDAELMFEALGFSSPKQMIIEGYGLELEEINTAVKWLVLRELRAAAEPPASAGDDAEGAE